jgi:hypothetical protein
VLAAVDLVSIEDLDGVGDAVVTAVRAHVARDDHTGHLSPRLCLHDPKRGQHEEGNEESRPDEKEDGEEPHEKADGLERALFSARGSSRPGWDRNRGERPSAVAGLVPRLAKTMKEPERSDPDGEEEQRHEDPEPAPEVGASKGCVRRDIGVDPALDRIADGIASREPFRFSQILGSGVSMLEIPGTVLLASLRVAVRDLDDVGGLARALDDVRGLDGANPGFPRVGVDALQPVDGDGDGAEQPQESEDTEEQSGYDFHGGLVVRGRGPDTGYRIGSQHE